MPNTTSLPLSAAATATAAATAYGPFDDMMQYIVDDEDNRYDWLDGAIPSQSTLDGGIMLASNSMMDDPTMSALLMQQRQPAASGSYYHPTASSVNNNETMGSNSNNNNTEIGDDGSTTLKQHQLPSPPTTASRLTQPPPIGDIFAGFDALSQPIGSSGASSTINGTCSSQSSPVLSRIVSNLISHHCFPTPTSATPNAHDRPIDSFVISNHFVSSSASPSPYHPTGNKAPSSPSHATASTFALNGLPSPPAFDSFASAGNTLGPISPPIPTWFSASVNNSGGSHSRTGSNGTGPSYGLGGGLGLGTSAPVGQPSALSGALGGFHHQLQNRPQAQPSHQVQSASESSMVSSSVPLQQQMHQNAYFSNSYQQSFGGGFAQTSAQILPSSSQSSDANVIPSHHAFTFSSPSGLSASLSLSSSLSTSAFSGVSGLSGMSALSGGAGVVGNGTIAPAQVYHSPPRHALQQQGGGGYVSPSRGQYQGFGGWDEGLGFMDGVDDSNAGNTSSAAASGNALGLGLGGAGSPQGRGRRLRRSTVRPNLAAHAQSFGGVSSASMFDMEMDGEDDDGRSDVSTRHDDEFEHDDFDEGDDLNGDEGITGGDDEDNEADDDYNDGDYEPRARRRRRVSHHLDGSSRVALFSPFHAPLDANSVSTSAPVRNGVNAGSSFGASSAASNAADISSKTRPRPRIGRNSTTAITTLGSSYSKHHRSGGTIRGLPGGLGLGAPAAAATTSGISTYTANGVTYASLPNHTSSSFPSIDLDLGNLPPGMSAAYLAASNASATLGLPRASTAGTSAPDATSSMMMPSVSNGSPNSGAGGSSAGAISSLTKRSRGRQVPVIRIVDVPVAPSSSAGVSVSSSAPTSSAAILPARTSRRTRTASRRMTEGDDDDVDEDADENQDGEDAQHSEDDDEYEERGGGGGGNPRRGRSTSSRSGASAGESSGGGGAGKRTLRASTRSTRSSILPGGLGGRRLKSSSSSIITLLPSDLQNSLGAGTTQQQQQHEGAGAAQAQAEMTWSDGRTRAYVCRVNGCGKCFQRGEHLKRHIRSIHTNDKRTFPILCFIFFFDMQMQMLMIYFIPCFLAFKCPHPGCTKDFSRRDNLLQHTTIHARFNK